MSALSENYRNMKGIKLTKKISEEQFDNGYWYVKDLKSFAKDLGITNSSKLRKDELETLIKNYLRTGKIAEPKRKNIVKKGIKDCELGLTLTLAVNNYTNNSETKNFIEKEASKINPEIKRKSGALYRLNRWRDEQITKGIAITYGDLVKEYVRLNEIKVPFEKVPHGRYINFLAEYMANEKGAKRKEAIEAWKELKKLNIPKEYGCWKEQRSNDTTQSS